jgi:hypothetical protein
MTVFSHPLVLQHVVHAAAVTGIYDRYEGGPVPVLLQALKRQ